MANSGAVGSSEAGRGMERYGFQGWAWRVQFVPGLARVLWFPLGGARCGAVKLGSARFGYRGSSAVRLGMVGHGEVW